MRVAFIVTHPIQYYAPLHRALAARNGWQVRVFFTWHGGESAHDEGFAQAFSWDVDLRSGYEAEVVPNCAKQPSSERFGGIRTPKLTERVLACKPDCVVLTGYAYAGHLAALWKISGAGVPVIFRGDSHLLDRGTDRWWPLKRAVLQKIYSRCPLTLPVGKASRAYFEACGVPPDRIEVVPHTIETARFSEPNDALEAQALEWRRSLGIDDAAVVLVFAGKFSEKKEPLGLMRTVAAIADPRLMLVMVGSGPLESEVKSLAEKHAAQIRVLPFQNQSRMPLVYRLGDVFVLPSSHEETWGLAVNEALACGRPALVSNRVGCASDLIREGATGWIFRAGDWAELSMHCRRLLAMGRKNIRSLGGEARSASTQFDTATGAARLAGVIERFLTRMHTLND